MTRVPLVDEALTLIGAFYEVYNALGFGFLEYLYVAAMERELRERASARCLSDHLSQNRYPFLRIRSIQASNGPTE